MNEILIRLRELLKNHKTEFRFCKVCDVPLLENEIDLCEDHISRKITIQGTYSELFKPGLREDFLASIHQENEKNENAYLNL